MLLGIGRKAGKTELVAGLGWYFLLADREPAAEVYSCAGDKEQARVMFNVAKTMHELSPRLQEVARVYRDVIEVPSTGSTWRVVSAEAYTKEGLNPSHVLFDELHVQRDRDFYDVMTLGSGARLQPLVLGLTTAGKDLDTICGERYQHGLRVQAGEVDDPGFLMLWHGLDPDDESPLDSPETWRKAHPEVGGIVSEEYVARLQQTKPEYQFRRYILNQWVGAEEAWLPTGAWAACRAPEPYELAPRRTTFGGADASTTDDSTGVVLAQWTDPDPETGATRLRVKARVWERPVVAGQPVREWKIPQAEVENHLRTAHELYELDTVNYDPALLHRAADVLEDEGLPMVRFPQTAERMVPACQDLYNLVVRGELEHDGDPALARHLRAAAAKETERGWRLVKTKSSAKIDLAVALAMAVHAAVERRDGEAGIRGFGFEDDEDGWEGAGEPYDTVREEGELEDDEDAWTARDAPGDA